MLAQADALYAPFSCPASGECCQLTKTQRPPWLWPPEWSVLEEALEKAKRTLPPPRDDGGCPFLDAAGLRCTVYADRPLGCRTFFCSRIEGPTKQPMDALNALSKRLEWAARRADDDAEPLPLPDWHRRAAALDEDGD